MKKYVSAHYYLGVVYRRQNRQDEALTEWCQAILTNEPYFKDIKQLSYKQIGDLYFFTTVYDSAIQNYRKTLEISIEEEIRGEILLGLGKSYLKTRHPQEAIQPLKQALNYIPENPDLHLSYRYAFLGVEENDRAMVEFQTTVRIDPDGPFGNKAKEILNLEDDIFA